MTVARRLATPPGPRRVLLFGNPNTGKTTLFNRLCGLRAKTANFPGTTSDLRRGKLSLARADSTAGASADAEPVEVVDLPGLYSLTLDLPESRVGMAAIEGADGMPPAAAIVVADATNLQRNLLLVAELARTGTPFVVALNMIDLARRRGLSFDLERLADAIGAPVVPIAARGGEGIDELLTTLRGLLDDTIPTGLAKIPEGGTDAVETWSERVVVESVGGRAAYGSATDTVLDRLDVAFTHPISGFVIFHLVMAVLFWTIFALATVPMDLIEATFSNLGSLIETNLPAGAVRDLLVGGLIGGVSGTVVFLPQICLLFFLITLLEDTGYLARAAFVMDRLLYRFGLPGYAFVPLLSSHACAIPGILATRLIPDRNDRFATILVAPFMSCSARLPVYVLLTSFLFPDSPGLAGLAFTGCYLLGTVAALSSAFLARRTLLPGKSRPMVLELPTYKWPSLRVAVSQALEQGWSFLTTVGTVILAICVVMWWLSAYPKAAEPPEATALRAVASERAQASGAVAAAPSAVPDATASALRVEDALGAEATLSPETPESLTARADALTLRHQQEQSFAGRLGRFAEPLFAPLGYDWRLTMGVLTSFAAREVLVSTLAVLVASPDDSERGVLRRIHDATRDDGTPLLTRATAVSMLVFFVLAMQCLSTVVTVRRETRHWKWPLLQFGWMTGLAWVSAFAAFHGLHALGIS